MSRSVLAVVRSPRQGEVWGLVLGGAERVRGLHDVNLGRVQREKVDTDGGAKEGIGECSVDIR